MLNVLGRQIDKNPQPTTLSVFFFLGKIYKLVKDCKCFLLSKNSHPSIHDKCQLFCIKGAYQGSLSNHNLCLLSVFTNSSINKLAFVTARYNICGAKVRCFLRSLNLKKTKRYEQLTNMKQSILYICHPAVTRPVDSWECIVCQSNDLSFGGHIVNL